MKRRYEKNASRSPWRDNWMPPHPTDVNHARALLADSEAMLNKQWARLSAKLGEIIDSYDGACLAWLAKEWEALEELKREHANEVESLYELVDEYSCILETKRVAQRYLEAHPTTEREPLTDEERAERSARTFAPAIVEAEPRKEAERLRQGHLFGNWGGEDDA